MAAATLRNFFGYLAEGDARAGALMTDVVVDLDADEALLLEDSVYAQIESKPGLVDVGDVSVSGDEIQAQVNYQMDGVEHDETLELVIVEKTDTVPEHSLIQLSPEMVGFDVTGAELLPEETVYLIHGVDVSAAFREAVASSAADESSPRVLAFGGSYPIEITVPGPDGFTDTLLLESSTFYGGDGTDGEFAEFVHAHGF